MLLGYNNNSDGVQDQGNAVDFLSGKIDPSFTQSINYGFQSSADVPFVLGSDLAQMAGLEPKKTDAMQEAYEVANQISGSASGINAAASALGNLFGTVANPLNILPAEKLGSLALSGSSKLLGYATDALPTFSDYISPTIAKTLPGISYGAASGAAISLPQSVADNYNELTGKLNTMGVVEGTLEGTGLGVALGAIPFAKALIKDRFFNKLPIEESEEDIKTPEQAEDVINKYTNNPNVTTQDGKVNFQVLNENDMDNLQSATADMVSANGEVDPNTLKATVSQSARNLLEDEDVMNALDGAIKDIQSTHDDIEKQITKRLSADEGSVAPTIRRMLGMEKEDSTAGMLDLFTNPENLDENKKLISFAENVKSNPNDYLKRSQNHVDKMLNLLDSRSKLATYKQTLQDFSRLTTLRSEDLSPENAISTIQDYLKKATTESDVGLPPEQDNFNRLISNKLADLSKVEPETSSKVVEDEPNSVEKSSGTPVNEPNSEENLEPESELTPEQDLNEGQKELVETYRQTAQAAKSAKSAEKVLQKLMQCFVENK